MGMPVDAAMGEARLAMGRGKGRPLEWATPLLTQRTPDGRIVSLASDSEEQRYQFNIVSFDDHGRERFDKYGAALLRLDEFFDGRPIRAPELWTEEILPGLKGWLRKGILPEQKSRINFAAHLTIVLATGRLLDVKSRRDVIVQQYDVDWDAEKGNPLPSPVWERNLPIEVVDENKTDLAVAVSLSRSILPGVQEYVSRGEGPAAQIGSILDATPTTGVGPTSVRDGVHASQLAQELINRLDEELANRPGTTIHLFLSAPQAFTFFFGMRTRSIPRLQMYEHHFGQGSSTYVPSVLFQGDGAY